MNSADPIFYQSVLKALKEGNKNNRIKLPNENNLVLLDGGNDTIKIELSAKAIGLGSEKSSNMQDIDACFEGWALVLKAFYKPESNLIVELGLSDDIDINKTPDFNDIIALPPENPDYEAARRQKYGHWGRFLYRALRFSQQYSSWFVLSANLKALTDKFDAFLTSHKEVLKNNLPSDEAMTKGSIKDPKFLDENIVEDILSRKNVLKDVIRNPEINIGENSYRQFPVGLVHGEKKIFTGRSSAIDLWNIGKDAQEEEVLNIIELKYNNKMLGIITELFFYVNYLYDFVSPNHSLTFMKYNSGKNMRSPRGYKKLYQLAAGECGCINGIMLSDEFHPLVNDKVLALMNSNNLSHIIHYYMERYDYEIRIIRHKKE